MIGDVLKMGITCGATAASADPTFVVLSERIDWRLSGTVDEETVQVCDAVPSKVADLLSSLCPWLHNS